MKCESTLLMNLKDYCRSDFPHRRRIKELIKDVSGFNNYYTWRKAEKIMEDGKTKVVLLALYAVANYVSFIL